jgi:hypothetical protein
MIGSAKEINAFGILGAQIILSRPEANGVIIFLGMELVLLKRLFGLKKQTIGIQFVPMRLSRHALLTVSAVLNLLTLMAGHSLPLRLSIFAKSA